MLVTALTLRSCTKYLLKTKPINCVQQFTNRNSLRTYKNISHGIENTPLMTTLYLGGLVGWFFFLVMDWKKIFNLHDEEKELEELRNYTIPDYYAVYTELPSKSVEKDSKTG